VIVLPYCKSCGAASAQDPLYCHRCGKAVRDVKVEEFSVSSDRLVEKVKQLLHEGNVTRVIVKDEKGTVLLDMPATAGVVGIVLAPLLAALGAVAALATNCTVSVERRE